jgi:hypothetical protein
MIKIYKQIHKTAFYVSVYMRMRLGVSHMRMRLGVSPYGAEDSLRVFEEKVLYTSEKRSKRRLEKTAWQGTS